MHAHRAAGRAAVPRREHQRLPGEQIAAGARRQLGRAQAGQLDHHVAPHRRHELAEEPRDLRLRRVVEQDHLGRAVADARHLVEEEPVHRRADAEREQVRRRSALLGDGREDLVLVADEPVGQEAHVAPATIGRRIGQRGADARQHLGAATGAHAGEPRLRAPQVVDRDRHHRAAVEAADVRREVDQPEPIARTEALERVADRLLLERQRLTAHRARGVEHEHQLARRRRSRGQHRRLDDRRQVAVAVGARAGEQRDRRLGDLDPPAHHHVLVGHGLGRRQRDRQVIVIALDQLQRVGRAVDLGHRRAGLQIEREAERRARRGARRLHRRRQPRRVGDLRRVVARAHHRR